MVAAVSITRLDLDAAGLRRAARRCREPHAARRMLALALVLEGASRTHAAQAAGMDRQTLRDWVHRYNGEGLAGLRDRHGGGARPLLSSDQEREVARWVSEGPDPVREGVRRWRRSDLVRAIERAFGMTMAERSIGDMLRRQGFRRLVPRPRHPGHDAAAQTSFRSVSPPS